MLLAVAVAGLVLVAIPVAAYIVVPALVRSTVTEKAPVAAPAALTVASPATGAVVPSPAAADTVLLRGDLRRINAVDFGTGHVTVLQVGDKRFLRFENVEIAAAPVQHVYLSDRSDGQPGSFTDLGSLRATSGSFNYELPAGLDLATVHSVVSWCKQFNTTVTYAVLAVP